MPADTKDCMVVAERFITAARGLRQAVGADVPLQQVMILVHLWRHGQSNQVELARALDLKIAAASRHCKSLSSYYAQTDDAIKEKGQKLILAERNPLNSREMVYRLVDNTQGVLSRFMLDLAGIKE
ncbi:MAG: helix-turn-helix domain-containing protein [Desulfuromonadaceae bacterium]